MKPDAEALRRLSRLLDEAVDLDAAGQAAWLDGLDSDAAPFEPALRRMLARQAEGALSEFLEHPPAITAPGADAAASDFRSGDQIGPYQLLRAIGRGGMGEVWLATRADGQLKRTVALKLPMLTVRRSVLLQRFERERDILAALIHPHIARLYDAGLADDGQPYMALEYVEGTPITDAADAGALDAAARIRLLRQVMDAVQYAHANLVIHRDLKPGNVLVTADGHAKLLDFGIAKLVEDEAGATTDSELTRLGGRALTLRYAAPELIAGGTASTAVDVWALGVLLYELLAGRRPFDSGSGGRIEQQIVSAEPTRPSQGRHGAIAHLSRGLAADLDTIALKALKKDPSERYASVGAFADDLDRWLRGEPVRAQPDSAWYRTRRFVGRNRLAIAAATTAGLALLGTAMVAVVLGLEAREESARAQAARNFMMDIFLQTDRDLSPGQEMNARQLLLHGYRTVVDTLQDQPLLQTELLLGIGDALDFMEELGPADDALARAAQVDLRVGRAREAAHTTLARAGMRYYNGWDRAAAPALIAEAVRMHPAPETDDEFMALHAINQAEDAGATGRPSDEKAWYERAGAYADRGLKDHRTRHVMAIRKLARLEGKYGADQRGRARLEALLARLRQDPRARPAWIVGALDDLGQIELSTGRYAAALARFEASDAHCRQAADPRGIQCIYSQLQRAHTLLLLGWHERAMETVPALLDRSQISPSSADIASHFTRQAFHVLMLNGQLDRHPAVEAEVRRLGDTLPDARWGTKLSFLLAQLRHHLHEERVAEAQALAGRVRGLLTAQAVGPGSAPEAELLLALTAQAGGDLGGAMSQLDDLLARRIAALGEGHARTQLFAVHRARALWAAGRTDEALAIIDRALPVLRRHLGTDAPTLLRVQALRAELAAAPAASSADQQRIELLL